MSDHTSQLFRPKEYEVLNHIHQILEIPHKCQELLAAEKTPTLSLALPVYEALVLMWKGLAKEIPELSHYIGLGIGKIMEYVSKGRRSRIYALAMSTANLLATLLSTDHLPQAVINPRTKFKWIKEHWSATKAADAEKWMEEAISIGFV
jgi:hypothetical protein